MVITASSNGPLYPSGSQVICAVLCRGAPNGEAMALTDSASGKVIREYSIEELKDAANLRCAATTWSLCTRPDPVMPVARSPSWTLRRRSI